MKVLLSAVSVLVLGVAGAALLSEPGYSQTDAEANRYLFRTEATIYRDAGYQGPAVFIGEEKANLDLN